MIFDEHGFPRHMDGMKPLPNDEFGYGCGYPHFPFRKGTHPPRLRAFDPDSYMDRGEKIEWKDLVKNLANPPKKTYPLIPISPCDVSRQISIIDAEYEEKKTPRVYEVVFEELDGDLMSGVKTKPLKEVNFTPPIYQGVGSRRRSPQPHFEVSVNDSSQDKDGNYIISVGSYVYAKDLKGQDDGAWSIFCLRGLSLLDLQITRFGNGDQKYLKITQVYKLSVEDRTIVPYIQLACNASRVKYLGAWYEEGQVITLFVSHHFMPKVPSPALISIQPKADQTFVPLMPKQKLQIITDISQVSLEFNLKADSAIFHTGMEVITDQRARNLGGNIRCDFFECVKDPETQELVFVNSKTENKFRTITVPVVCQTASQRRYPVIIDPIRDCVIHSHNIDGFIMRGYKKFNIQTDKECPLQLVYALERDGYCEIKVKLTKPQPYFRLEKTGNSDWIAKID
jgi:hypothetical protein